MNKMMIIKKGLKIKCVKHKQLFVLNHWNVCQMN